MAVHPQQWSVYSTEQMSRVSDVIRQFIPTESGEPIEEQIFPWSMDGLKQKMQKPIPLHEADPETISNIIQMMCVEMQHWFGYTAMANMTSNEEIKKQLVTIARAEHIHHMMLMSLLPAPHEPVQGVLEGELAMLGSYAMCMANEPNDAVRSAFQTIFNDHLQHAEYAAQKVNSVGCATCNADMMSGGCDLSGGTPIEKQFMKPEDTIWQGNFGGSYDKNNVDPQTLINIDMGRAGEAAAYDLYHCAMSNVSDADVRMNFAAFESIEGQHAAILGSLVDPSETPVERALIHEQVEIRNYQRLMDEERDSRAKKVFQDLYREDLEQARIIGEFVQR